MMKKRKVYALLMPMPVPHHISTVHTVSVMHAVFLNVSVVSAIYCQAPVVLFASIVLGHVMSSVADRWHKQCMCVCACLILSRFL